MWSSAYQFVIRQVHHFNQQEWLFVLLGTVLLGLFCLRGFGSRSRY
ncbi:MAG: hypothetical protein K6T86_19370 [Pirellulales bacterium]|nr:hypothetical protein [Pirellulales bacterium]